MSDARAAHRRGVVLVLLAGLLWSCTGCLIKSPVLTAIDGAHRGPLLACYRALFAAVALAPFVAWRRVRWRWGLIPLLVSFLLMNTTYITAVTRTTAAAAIFLQYTAIVWAALGGAWLLGERLDRGMWVALGGAVLGIVVIVGDSLRSELLVGNLLALGSGVAYAGVVLSLRFLRDEDSAWLVAAAHLAAGAALWPWVHSFPVALSGPQWGLIALSGSAFMALPYVVFARGIRTVSALEAALLPIVEPLLNPLWVWLCWGEAAPPATWLGGALILSGLVLRSVWFRPVAPTEAAAAPATPAAD